MAEVDLESKKSELVWVLKANMPKKKKKKYINYYFATKHSNKKAEGETSNVNYKMHQFLNNEKVKSTDNSVYQGTFNVMVSAAEPLENWVEKKKQQPDFHFLSGNWSEN